MMETIIPHDGVARVDGNINADEDDSDIDDDIDDDYYDEGDNNQNIYVQNVMLYIVVIIVFIRKDGETTTVMVLSTTMSTMVVVKTMKNVIRLTPMMATVMITMADINDIDYEYVDGGVDNDDNYV